MRHFNRVGMAVAGTERIIPAHAISAKGMGLVYSAFLAFYTLAMLPCGWLIDRFGARRALVVLGFAMAVFVAATGVVGSILQHGLPLLWGLLIVRSLLGIASAPLHPGSARMVADQVAPERRARGNGWVTFSACVGIAATQLVLGGLIDRFDWPAAFWISGGMTVIVAVIWSAASRGAEVPRFTAPDWAHPQFDKAALKSLLRRPGVVGITLSYTAYGYFQYLFFYWITYYFETIQHQDHVVARWYSTSITLAMGLGMVCGGFWADWVPAPWSPWSRRAVVPMVGLFASGAVFELGLLAPNPQHTFAAFVLSAALLGLCEAPFWTTAVELGGPIGGTVAALMNTGGNAGGTLSPYVTPALSEWIAGYYGQELGWRLSLSVAGIIAFVGGILWWMIRPDARS